MEWETASEILAALLVCTGLTYLFFRHLLLLLPPIVHLSFATALFFCFAALFAPPPFVAAAELCVRASGLPTALQAVDDRIRAVEEMPEKLSQQFWETLGMGEDEPPLPPVGPPHARRAATGVAARELGDVEAAVVPHVVSIVEILLRFFTFALSSLVLIITLILRMLLTVLGTSPRTRRLEARIAELEAIAATEVVDREAGSAVEG